MPVMEANKRSGTTRKRPNKAKQIAPLGPAFTSKQEEIRAYKADESQFATNREEAEERGGEQLVSSKIIQLQNRMAKTRPLAGFDEQNKDDQSQEKTGKQSPTSFYERSS
jgi:hypothetical protein